MRMRAHVAMVLGSIAALLLAGCQKVDRPNRPLPDFKATRLDGTKLTRESLRGKPWLINLWVPG